MDRRELLKLGALAGAAAATGVGAHALSRPSAGAGAPGRFDPRGPDGPLGGRRVRNVIFLAYDGTGYEDFATADFFARRVVGEPLRYHRFLSEGLTGVMVPSSLLAWVTDSSAASTAWATGRKIRNGAVNQYPDGTELTPILELARATGRATGLVTTARATHATPAGWVARVPEREMEDEIALQYLASGTDLILGGGQRHFEASARDDGRDLFAEFEAAGYEVVKTREELAAATGTKLLGTFAPSNRHVAYEIDRRFGGVDQPSLAEMVRAALPRLDAADGGFVLQVEAGRIDHANHEQDAGAMAWDWIAADEALGVLLEFVAGRDDTLLIHAPDHDTGGGVTFGWGPRYTRTDPALLTFANLRCSYERLLLDLMPENPSPAQVRELVQTEVGVPVTEATAEHLAAIVSGADLGGLRWGHQNAVLGGTKYQLAQLLSMSSQNVPERPPVSFATSNHTAGFVPVVLAGAGIETGNLGVIDNTELFGVMTGALGIDFENPYMSPEEAQRIVDAP
jgi:alkaline phosphatase